MNDLSNIHHNHCGKCGEKVIKETKFVRFMRCNGMPVYNVVVTCPSKIHCFDGHDKMFLRHGDAKMEFTDEI